MTYGELLQKLLHLPTARLNDDAIVYDGTSDEYYPVVSTFEAYECIDVLDPEHFVIQINV